LQAYIPNFIQRKINKLQISIHIQTIIVRMFYKFKHTILSDSTKLNNYAITLKKKEIYSQ